MANPNTVSRCFELELCGGATAVISRLSQATKFTRTKFHASIDELSEWARIPAHVLQMIENSSGRPRPVSKGTLLRLFPAIDFSMADCFQVPKLSPEQIAIFDARRSRLESRDQKRGTDRIIAIQELAFEQFTRGLWQR